MYLPHPDAGFIHWEAERLDKMLREGDGIFWAGDPRLWLGMGVIERHGHVVARRYEVWRHTEEGEDVLIGHWRLEEFDRILMDLSGMRLDAPGHVDVVDAIDKENAKLEAANDAKMHDAMGEMMEHGLKLWHDRNNPKNTFRQVGGTGAETVSSDAAE